MLEISFMEESMLRRNPSRTLQCLHSKLNPSFCSQVRYRKLFCLVLLILVFGSMTGTHVVLAAQKLFGESTGLERQGLAAADSTRTAAIKRFRNVKINLTALNAQADASAQQIGSNDAVDLNLFDDANLTAVRIKTEKSADGKSESWIGRIEGMRVGQAVLTVSGDLVAGTINTDDGRLFEIRPTGKGLHVIRELNPDAFPEDLEPLETPIPAAGDNLESDSPAEFDTGSTIDVMVLYTPAARTAAGGTAAMNTEVDNAIALANTGYQNSGVTQRLRLVYKGEISYSESSPNTLTGYQTDLARLRNTDGYMDSVHTLRNRYGADFVTLFIKNSAACGLGYIMTSESTGFAVNAFNVVDRGCISNFSFAHELGHNMGVMHDRANSSSLGVFSYSYGYGQPGGYRDTMAYQSACGSGACPRVNYWSGPSVTYNSNPLGIAIGQANEADGVSTLNNTVDTTINFRANMLPTLSSPSGSGSDATPTFTWTAAAGATSYLLYLETTAGVLKYQNSYSTVAAGCAAGTGNCSVTPVVSLADGNYRWYIQASNSSGAGNWTAATSFSISGGGYSVPTVPSTVTLTSPSGATTNSSPVYVFSKSSSATYYELYIETNTGVKKHDVWYTAAQADCPADGAEISCSITPSPDPALMNGSYRWYVRAYNGAGNGTLTAATAFTISVTAPGAATLSSPSGSISNSSPAYSWAAVSGATKYELYIDTSTGVKKHDIWYSAVQASCSGGGTCSITPNPDPALTNGNYRWFIRTANWAGNGAWSAAKSFAVSVTVPSDVTLTSPSGTVTNSSPAYVFSKADGATYYELYVETSAGVKKHDVWYSAAQADCPVGGVEASCSIVPTADPALTNGSYKWYVRAYNGAGTSAWSAATAFTVAATLPGAATLATPSGTITNSSPTYSWNAVSGATFYELYIETSAGVKKHDKWYSAVQARCSSGGTCSIDANPDPALTPGVYRWYIRTYNGAGNGAWSSATTFQY
jgi:hypothetical protein